MRINRHDKAKTSILFLGRCRVTSGKKGSENKSMHHILALHKWPKTSETIFFSHCLTSFEPTTLHQMVWTSLATNFTSSVRNSQLLFKKFLLYILCNEIVKCGDFKRTLETGCQTFGKKHCKGPSTWCNIARNIARNIFFFLNVAAWLQHFVQQYIQCQAEHWNSRHTIARNVADGAYTKKLILLCAMLQK